MEFDFTLRAVFGFNPQAIPKNPKPSEQDQQDAKLLFYYPSQQNQEEKRIQTGMAEGIFIFCSQFAEDAGAQFETVHLESQTHIIYRIRPDLFIFMTLKHANFSKVAVIQDEYFYQECHKFHFGIQQKHYEAVVRNFWEFYSLYYGENYEDIDSYVAKWINCNSRTQQTMNLVYFNCQSLRYAGLDGQLFLTLQYLFSMLQQIAQIDDIIIFYLGYFIYSSLPHKQALLFREHYYGSGMPWSAQEQKVQSKFQQYDGTHDNAFMTFLNMRQLLKEGGNNIRPQKIYQNGVEKNVFTYLERGFLTILITEPVKEIGRYLSVVTAINKNTEKICQKLDLFLDNGQKQDQFKFIYFNGMNLAYKISSQILFNKLTPNEFRMLYSIYEKLNQTNLQVHRCGGQWFVGTKMIDKRVILIIPSTVQLIKLEEEIQKMTEIAFPGSFV
ncbi:hypothetical protein pb186bvf_009111 [Paramecium bursaria]